MILKNGGGYYDNIEIKPPTALFDDSQYNLIQMGTLMGLKEIQEQLIQNNISLIKLEKTYVEISVSARIFFLKRLTERFEKEGLKGSVAEAGVFRGEFAKEINRYFPKSKLYLFECFSGFDERDYQFETKDSLIQDVNHFAETTEEIVLNKMMYKENVEIKKGFFPESINGLEDDFIFVSLDMDLYKPTLEGLRYFYPRMIKGGVFLIHDYFSDAYPNIEKSVSDYEEELGDRLFKMPIEDDISMAIIK